MQRTPSSAADDRDDAGASVGSDAAGEASGEATAPATDLSVLNLVTTEWATFYRQQVETLVELGVEVETIPVSGDHSDGEVSRSPADYLRLVRAVRRADLDRFDVVHANYGLTAPAALAQRDCPVVVSLWGSDLLGRAGPLARWCARRADAVVVMTEGMRRALGRPCHVVPHGVDRDRFRPMPRAVCCARLGWDPDGKHVFFPYPSGRAVKNFPVARRVAAAADDRIDPTVVLHVGEGRLRHAEMPVYMNAADALLLPSDREGSPNTVKEALACNLPVVATPVGDVPQRLAGVEPSAVREDEGSLADALVSILRSDERSNGREAVASVGLDAMGRRLLGVYGRALERRG